MIDRSETYETSRLEHGRGPQHEAAEAIRRATQGLKEGTEKLIDANRESDGILGLRPGDPIEPNIMRCAAATAAVDDTKEPKRELTPDEAEGLELLGTTLQVNSLDELGEKLGLEKTDDLTGDGSGTALPELEYVDRYSATGRPRPRLATVCKGQCEGMGVVPTSYDAAIEAGGDVLDAWKKAHADACLALEKAGVEGRCDGWHFLPCLTCRGTGLRDRAQWQHNGERITAGGAIEALDKVRRPFAHRAAAIAAGVPQPDDTVMPQPGKVDTVLDDVAAFLELQRQPAAELALELELAIEQRSLNGKTALETSHVRKVLQLLKQLA
ncbi:MAG TPA: hypothetical protein VD838_05950 [Anaeromyxobacteraceae bacterium]|nr:hypothetical protein [Anaeromyxobacteraceae bacterium]